MMRRDQRVIGNYQRKPDNLFARIPLDQFPPYDAVMEALTDMMDRALLPEDGGNSEAGKAIFRQITAVARARMEQVKQSKDTKQMIREGATNDN